MVRSELRIRLARAGFTKKPFYIIHVLENWRRPQYGRPLEKLGFWDPTPASDGNQHIGVKTDRVKFWLAKGAVMTGKVEMLLGRLGLAPVPPPPPSQPRTPDMDTKWRSDLKEKANK